MNTTMTRIKSHRCCVACFWQRLEQYFTWSQITTTPFCGFQKAIRRPHKASLLCFFVFRHCDISSTKERLRTELGNASWRSVQRHTNDCLLFVNSIFWHTCHPFCDLIRIPLLIFDLRVILQSRGSNGWLLQSLSNNGSKKAHRSLWFWGAQLPETAVGLSSVTGIPFVDVERRLEHQVGMRLQIRRKIWVSKAAAIRKKKPSANDSAVWNAPLIAVQPQNHASSKNRSFPPQENRCLLHQNRYFYCSQTS